MLTDKQPDEDCCNSCKDEKCHDNPDDQAGLGLWLWRPLFVGQEVDLLMVAVMALMQKKKEQNRIS